MWFGNLVTPEFWTQLWLKEGAARYLEFVAINRLFPEWRAWELFTQGVYVYGVALNLDAMVSSHPVEVPVKTADEIGEIFDTISYAKGASVIRMLSSYVGRENFFMGMRRYLERHKWGNAVSSDFWQALEEESGLPIVNIASPWTLRTGYPIFETADDPGVQRSALSVMGRVKDRDRHAEMLEYALYSGKVRYQDMAFVLNGLATTTSEGGRKCWDNFVSDFDRLVAKFREQHVVWGMLLGVTTRGLKTCEEANVVEQFFADPDHPAGAGQRRVAQALEAVRTNAARLDRDRDAVASFLGL